MHFLGSTSISAWLVAGVFLAASVQAVAVVGVHTGVNQTTGERPMRRNINDIYNEAGAQWDLLVQAMALFQASNMTDVESYFQIAGIHGLPYIPWDGVEQVPGGAMMGYCPHGQTNFVTWHRPYTALFEQILVSYVHEVASQYPPATAGANKAAAEVFRLPFWDWASNASLPEAAAASTVRFNGPSGPQSMANPLFSYQFPPDAFRGSGLDRLLTEFNETKRCTPMSGALKGITNTTKATNVLNGHGNMLKGKVYAVFTQSNTFEAMSSTAHAGASLEDPHNFVHNDVACSKEPERIGHMGDLRFAGFDPIFFLHHANVDRLFAMWQAIHPQEAVFSSTQHGAALFGTAKGPQTADSPLRPFRTGNSSADTDSDDFHTSRSVADMRTFGYSYPELPDWALTAEELASSVRAAVNRLYGPRRGKVNLNSGNVNANIQGNVQGNGTWGNRLRRRASLGILGSTDYSVQLSVERADLPRPCSIDLRLVDATGGFVRLGGTVLLDMPPTGKDYTVVPLRETLLADARGTGSLSFANSDIVMAQLRERLRVTIVTHNGTAIPAASVPSLHVEIQQCSFTPAAASDAFPQYGPITRWPLALGGVGSGNKTL